MAQDQHNPPAAFIASRHRNPLEDMNLKPAVNYTWAAIIAILTTLMFIGIVVLQWMEWDFFKTV